MPSRICWNVMAGVDFLSPTCFRNNEPSGNERQCLMMKPTRPTTNFVIGKSRFALASLNALLDPMFRFRDPSQFLQFGFWSCVTKAVVVDNFSVLVLPSDHYQQFFRAH